MKKAVKAIDYASFSIKYFYNKKELIDIHYATSFL
jgi:hypothetical protein